MDKDTKAYISSAFINLHYDGDKIKEHTMDWYEFSSSIDGLSCLLKNVAETLGVPENQLTIEIGSIQDGGLKTKIIIKCAVGLWFLDHIGGYALDNALDALNADTLIQEQTINLKNKVVNVCDKSLDLASDIIDRTNTFISNKLDKKNKNNPIKLLAASRDSIDTKIMKNPNNHKCLEQFVECLSNDIEKLEYTTSFSDGNKRDITFTPNELPLLINPLSNEKKEDDEENVSKVYVILRLEGSHLTGEEWSFTEINKSRKKKTRLKKYKAEVFDQWLLKLGRENALAELKDVDLYCEMLVKRITKDKRDTIKRVIIKCSTENFAPDLFNN